MAVFLILVLFTVAQGLLSQKHYVEGFVAPSLTWSRERSLKTLTAASKQNEDPTPKQTTTKEDLLLAISSFSPTNRQKQRQQTKEILNMVRDLELQCPTPHEQVLEKLQGNWTKLWRAKDPPDRDFFFHSTERESNSNNPSSGGSSESDREESLLSTIQDVLEALCLCAQAVQDILFAFAEQDAEQEDTIRWHDYYFFDLERQQVYVSPKFEDVYTGTALFTITMVVNFRPDGQDPRKISWKEKFFQRAHIAFHNTPQDITVPLKFVDATGWIRTLYVDDTLLIWRGHRGGVSVLQQTSAFKESERRKWFGFHRPIVEGTLTLFFQEVRGFLEQLDEERLNIAKALNLEVKTIFDHFSRGFHVPISDSISDMNQEIHKGGKDVYGPTSADSRYVTEVFGLTLLVTFGELINRPAILHQSGLQILSAMYGRNFMNENDLLNALDWKRYDLADLQEAAFTGSLPANNLLISHSGKEDVHTMSGN